MTTRDFIRKTYNTTSDKERQCSSVFTDNIGTVYSYGYHYPLAFRVAGRDFVNTAGYSNTTAKHINWAWQAVGYHAISVELNRDDARVISDSCSLKHEKLETIRQAIVRKHTEVTDQMLAKKRKDTWVYSDLQRQASELANSLAKVMWAQ